MKRYLALACLFALALAPVLLATEAWARTPSGSPSGSRGSRSYSSPASPSKPTQPSSPASPVQPAQPQRSGWGGALMGGLAGLALGGLLGSMFFGHGGGGIGLMEILLIAGGAYLIFRMMRSRQATPAPAGGYGQGGGGTQWQPQAQTYQPQTVDTGPSDLERGVGYIRQMDAAFDPARFTDTASDVFFRVQAAWMARDMSQASGSLTPEMADTLQKDCDRLRGQGRINRLENIAVRSVTVTEAWQESGQDYVTVQFLASLLDYTVDERSGQVVEGSRTEPVKFEEFWTFVRPVGPNAWRLSAIQQG
jgi:predicted lipid-binding transport protein (Tim44 family)